MYVSPGLELSNADRSHRHERGPRDVLRDFVLLRDAAHVESSATPSPVAAAASSERAQRRQGEIHV
jgi:hypothetical protein